MRPVLAAARAAVARRRLQTWIIGVVVLLTATTSVVALGLLAVSHGPFDAAFARAAGAHLAVATSADVPAADLSATARAGGVTASAGPFETAVAAMEVTGGALTGARFPQATIVGRSAAGGDVDRLTVDSGRWLAGPGEIVVSREYAGPLAEHGGIGGEVSLALPGTPKFRVVGVADSATGTADAWLWPSDLTALHATGRQMLYRFAAADTDAEVAADRATIGAALPKDAIASATSWLNVRQAANRSISAFVPFVIAFAVLGLVLAVLITGNVVNGAVVAGFRTIGVLKTLGFTPGQVVAAYVVQVAVPALVGCALGVAGGVALAAPLLADTQRAYNLPANLGGVPIWVIVLVAVGAPLLVAVSALGPATRAGRLAANEAISVGRAPRAGRGFRVRRTLAATRLPRSVAFGLGLPFARPARTAGTVVAIMLGAVTLVFAVGLTASLARVHAGFTRVGAVPIVVDFAGPDGPPRPGPGSPSQPVPAVDPAHVAAIVAAQAGTARSVGFTSIDAHLTGVPRAVNIDAYDGDASWTGHPMIAGRWFAGPGEAVASSYTLRQTGLHVGDRIELTGDTGRSTVTITGSFLDGGDDYRLVTGFDTASSLAGPLQPGSYEVGLAAGRDAHAYATALQSAFGTEDVYVDERSTHNDNRTFVVLDALIGTLTLLLCAVAALGVLNTVVLNTRERVHDIGVLKAIGMTPRQLRAMVVSSMVGLGVPAGVVAVPLGVVLERWIVPRMAGAAGTDIPGSIIAVYGPTELVALGLTGVVLAVIGALLPAGWASSIRAAHALRAE